MVKSLSKKRALRERREARLKSTQGTAFQCGQRTSMKHIRVSVSGVQGSPAQATVTARHLQQTEKKCANLMLFHRLFE